MNIFSTKQTRPGRKLTQQTSVWTCLFHMPSHSHSGLCLLPPKIEKRCIINTFALLVQGWLVGWLKGNYAKCTEFTITKIQEAPLLLVYLLHDLTTKLKKLKLALLFLVLTHLSVPVHRGCCKHSCHNVLVLARFFLAVLSGNRKQHFSTILEKRDDVIVSTQASQMSDF